MKMKKLPVGKSDFKRIIEENYYYVDKTLLIKEVIDSGDSILLIPRPRRFGKTLNLSMIGYFYACNPVTWEPEIESPETNKSGKGTPVLVSYKHLFDSLAISTTGPEYLDKMSQYPVISLSFKDIKNNDWDSCLDNIKDLIRIAYTTHYSIFESMTLMPHEKEYIRGILDQTGTKSDYANSLKNLLIFLSRFYNRRVVVLVDEYDTPIHAGFANGYYDEIVNFMRIFLGGGFKDVDAYLEKGILTGIMRIARESFFSDLNNLGVYSLLSKKFSSCFGFTETEVRTMLCDFNVSDMLEQVQFWYNGYRFGEKVIYNPWSIINFLNSGDNELKPYWVNTSDNTIVNSLLSRGGKELKKELEQLIRGETIEKPVNENIVLRDIEKEEELLWSFLLMGGYLKQEGGRRLNRRMYYMLSIPNEEVKTSYDQVIRRYFDSKIENERLEILLKALIDGDIELFEELLGEFVLKAFSYHDFNIEPENVYHALVMGLLVWISDTHDIKSNRESGFGRYDIMIIPKDVTKIGYVIEFKTVRKTKSETVEIAVEKALKQIEEKKYETELIERGIKNIKKLAIVFNGKDVHVKEGI